MRPGARRARDEQVGISQIEALPTAIPDAIVSTQLARNCRPMHARARRARGRCLHRDLEETIIATSGSTESRSVGDRGGAELVGERPTQKRGRGRRAEAGAGQAEAGGEGPDFLRAAAAVAAAGGWLAWGWGTPRSLRATRHKWVSRPPCAERWGLQARRRTRAAQRRRDGRGGHAWRARRYLMNDSGSGARAPPRSPGGGARQWSPARRDDLP